MKKILLVTCTLLTFTASACFSQNIRNSTDLIASAGYQPSTGYKGATGYKSSGGYKGTQGYKSSAGQKSSGGNDSNSNSNYNNIEAQNILQQAGKQNSSQLSQGSTKQQALQLQQWLDSNPAAAKELQQITQTGSDQSQQVILLQQWCQNHPESTQQLQQLLLLNQSK